MAIKQGNDQTKHTKDIEKEGFQNGWDLLLPG